jgi:hypothetical protein
MNRSDLHEEIAIELESMEKVVQELLSLQTNLGGREPTTLEKTAAAAFLAQFYNGIENILKRINAHNGIEFPYGPNWHVELFQRFVTPHSDLPQLFDERLAAALAPYRRFRHVVFHSYGFQLDWERMTEGIEGITAVFDGFKTNLNHYLQRDADAD